MRNIPHPSGIRLPPSPRGRLTKFYFKQKFISLSLNTSIKQYLRHQRLESAVIPSREIHGNECASRFPTATRTQSNLFGHCRKENSVPGDRFTRDHAELSRIGKRKRSHAVFHCREQMLRELLCRLFLEKNNGRTRHGLFQKIAAVHFLLSWDMA